MLLNLRKWKVVELDRDFVSRDVDLDDFVCGVVYFCKPSQSCAEHLPLSFLHDIWHQNHESWMQICCRVQLPKIAGIVRYQNEIAVMA